MTETLDDARSVGVASRMLTIARNADRLSVRVLLKFQQYGYGERIGDDETRDIEDLLKLEVAE